MDACTTCLFKGETLVFVNNEILQLLTSLLQSSIVNVTNLLSLQTKICYQCHATLQDICSFRTEAVKSIYILTDQDQQSLTNNTQIFNGNEFITETLSYNEVNEPNFYYGEPNDTLVQNEVDEALERNKVDKELELMVGDKTPVAPEATVTLVDFGTHFVDDRVNNETIEDLLDRKLKQCTKVSQKRPLVQILPPAHLVGVKQNVESSSGAGDHNYSQTVEGEDSKDKTSVSDDENFEMTKTKQWYIRVLTTDQILARMSEKRRKPEFLTAPYKCNSCVIVFRDETQSKNHAKECHGASNGRFSCYICTRRFHTMPALNRHVSLHCRHVYVCAKCSFDTYDRRAIQHHRCDTRRVSKQKSKGVKVTKGGRTEKPLQPKVLECQMCHKAFKSRTGFTRHMELVHKDLPREPCKVCKKTFKHHYSLKMHMCQAHSNKPKKVDTRVFRCEPCDYTFANQNCLKIHLTTSQKHVNSNDFKFACGQCERKFHRKGLLEDHITIIHLKQKLHKCILCDKAFSTRRGLKSHAENAHENKVKPRKFKCDICGEAFTMMKILEQHQRRHTGDRPFMCEHCPSTFSHSGALYTHRRLRHGIRGKTAAANPLMPRKEPITQHNEPTPQVNVVVDVIEVNQ